MSGKIDVNAFYNIEYGLYIVTSNDGKKDNGCIVNAVNQVTNDPARIAVAINKKNYSCDIIKDTGIMNLCCLSKSAPFDVFKHFGFVSGRDTDKFEKFSLTREKCAHISAPAIAESPVSIECVVRQKVELESHVMFLAEIVGASARADWAEGGKLHIPDGELIAYVQNRYVKTGETVGTYGFTAKK